MVPGVMSPLLFVRVGMRFETSQTTPAYLDRRMQRRMLSFVGLIAVIMFTLSALNGRMGSRTADTQRSRVSPDTLTYEVLREERTLKEGEFIIPVSDENGLRAASPRTFGAKGHDSEPFTSRDKERNRDDDALFQSRSGKLKKGENRTSGEHRNSIDLDPPDEELTVHARPIGRLDREPPTSAPLADEDWGAEPAPVAAKGLKSHDRLPERSSQRFEDEPVTLDGTTGARDGGEIERPSVVKPIPRHHTLTESPSREPFGSDRLGQDRRESSNRGRSPIEIEDVVDVAPMDRRVPTPRDRRINDSQLDSFNGENLEPPIDLRRRRDPSRSTAPDSPAPYGEVAPVLIDRRYLDIVKDNTVGIRRDEAEVYYWLLDHARRVPTSALERAGEREVQYINLMTEPDRFRGEPITIEGDLWRLYEFEAGKNAYGVSRIYEGWIFTGDSGNHPYRVVCTSLPNGIEPGENLRKPVRVTGYFFKKEGYSGNGGVTVAPTLLARRISINPMPNGIPQTSGILPYMIGAIMAVGLALLVTIVGFAIGDGRSSRQEMARLRRQPQISFAGLDVPDPVSIEESLRQLSELERDTAVNGAYGPLFSKQAAREHAVHDYATSHQLQLDASDRVRRQQTGVLQNWSARQQAAQAEIDSLRVKQGPGTMDSSLTDDELGNDQFDPATNLLAKPRNPQATITKPSFSPKAKAPLKVSPLEAAPAGSQVTVPSAATSTGIPAVSTVPTSSTRPANISYGATKLSEYEDEIAKMAGPAKDLPSSNLSDTSALEAAAALQIEQDRLARDQALRDQIRIDREQFERDRLVRDNVVHEHLDVDRVAFDRADRDSKSFTLADPDLPTTEPTDLVSDDLSDDSSSTSRWGRIHKRRNR